MEKLKIVFASPEVVPFVKTGGLADVAGMLPRVLARRGHDIKVVMPRYSLIPDRLTHDIHIDREFSLEIDGRERSVEIGRKKAGADEPEYIFVGNEEFFDRCALYVDPGTGRDYTDNDNRFIFFCRAILEYLKKSGWSPDIVHANDWQTALLPTYLATSLKDDPFYKSARTVFTIHNLAYQGTFPPTSFRRIGLDEKLFYATGPFEFWGKVNFMKSAIHYAAVINTVSEGYAREIRSSEEYGCGLEGVLDSRSDDLYGIVNGVDYSEWSPGRDKFIPFQYHVNSLSGKRRNKVELINRLELPFRDYAPLIGMITRLADQKGLDLVEKAADDLFALDIQMVVLGTGDDKYHQLLSDLESRYPDKLKALLTYDNEMAHWIEAGADMFLMPSRYEPCGLNQLYSLKYGTPPVVRATGGLADTITDVDEKSGTGTGFVFEKYDPDEMLAAIKRAVAIYPKTRKWRRIVKEGMRQDFSWARSADKYLELYQRAMSKN